MLTQRGWAALGASVALGLLWLGLGELELLTAALLLTGATVISALMIRLLRPQVDVVRRLSPTLVHEGDHAIVEATIINRGRWPISNPVVEDKVVGLGAARFVALVHRQGRGRPRHLSDPLPAARCVSGGTGLGDSVRSAPVWSGTASDAGLSDRLIVYPAVEDLEGFPITRGRDPSHQAARPEFSHMGGEDFFTLREYRYGDDLRHVHWPSSAKRDQLMIRQLETPWQSHGPRPLRSTIRAVPVTGGIRKGGARGRFDTPASLSLGVRRRFLDRLDFDSGVRRKAVRARYGGARRGRAEPSTRHSGGVRSPPTNGTRRCAGRRHRNPR